MADRARVAWVNRWVNRVLVPLFRARKGRLSFRGNPLCIVHTTGAKTGQPRQTPLLCVDIGDHQLALVGSNGGDDKTPAWVHNIRAHPDVEVEIAGERRSMAAAVADAETRARLWPIVVEKYPSYANYQRKTDRQIPLIVLTPR